MSYPKTTHQKTTKTRAVKQISGPIWGRESLRNVTWVKSPLIIPNKSLCDSLTHQVPSNDDYISLFPSVVPQHVLGSLPTTLTFFFYDQNLFPQLDQPQTSQAKLESSALSCYFHHYDSPRLYVGCPTLPRGLLMVVPEGTVGSFFQRDLREGTHVFY